MLGGLLAAFLIKFRRKIMAKIVVEYTEEDIKRLIIEDMDAKMPGVGLNVKEIHVEVASKQNYKSEWEDARFRARINVNK
jgi:TATA-binding protein-associated factor Taf7